MHRAITSGHPRLTFAVLVAGVSSYTLLQSMTVPVLPRIQAELDTTQAAASWILTAFLISASVATPIFGRLGDAHGKIRVLVLSLALLALGALGAALATSLWAMVAARVVQGLAGGVLPLAFGIIRDELPAQRVPSAVAMLSSLMSVGFGAGIVISGPLVHLVDYRVLFVLPMTTATLAAAGTWLLVRESPGRTGQPVRLLPALALTGWLVSGLLAVSEAPRVGWTSYRTLALLLLAALLLAVWVRIESRIDVPLIDIALLVDRRVRGANMVALLIGVSMYGSFGFLPQLVQTPEASGYGLGASLAESGYLMLPTAVLSFLAGALSPRLARRLGERVVITSGCWLSAAGLLSAALAHAHGWQILLANCLIGLGSGWCFAALANVVVAAAPVGRTGVATGLNANLRTIGGSIGSAVLASIITHRLLPDGFPAEAGYTAGFGLLAAASLAAGLVALKIPATRSGLGTLPTPKRSAMPKAKDPGEPGRAVPAPRSR